MRLVTIAYPGKPGKFGMTHVVPFNGAFESDGHRETWFAHAICGVRARFNIPEDGLKVECSRCLAKLREGRIS